MNAESRPLHQTILAGVHRNTIDELIAKVHAGGDGRAPAFQQLAELLALEGPHLDEESLGAVLRLYPDQKYMLGLMGLQEPQFFFDNPRPKFEGWKFRKVVKYLRDGLAWSILVILEPRLKIYFRSRVRIRPVTIMTGTRDGAGLSTSSTERA